MNNALIFTLFTVIIFIYYFISKNTQYNIQDNSLNIQKNLESHILNNKADISVLSVRYFDNARIVSFVYRGEFGLAVFLKGANGRLMLNWVNYGGSRCFSRVITTNRGKYLIGAGDNRSFCIDRIETEIKNKTIRYSTRDERYFLKIWPLESKETLEGITLMRLYDKANNNITEELMYSKAPSIELEEAFLFASDL